MTALIERTRPHAPAVIVAHRLRRALEHHAIAADVYEGEGVALVSIRLELLVWVEFGSYGWRFRWWTGRTCEPGGRWVYTQCPAAATSTAARRVAERYRELRAARTRETRR